MKRLLSSLFIIIFFLSCSKTPYLPYHSTAGIPHDTQMVQTEMMLMNSKSTNTDMLSYAVISALDNDQTPYLLISPTKNVGTAKKELWDYNISYSTNISPKKAQNLINSLDQILRKWDSDEATKEGYFYEFTNTPEHKMVKESENVVEKFPSIRVNFNLTEKGSVGTLIIGEGQLKYLYDFEEKEDVKKFRNLLQSGLDALHQM